MKFKFKHLIFLTIFALVFSVGIFCIIKIKNEKYLLTVDLKHLKYDDFYYLDVDIEGQTISLLLDTGADKLVSLQKETLQKIKNKKEMGSLIWQDANARIYEETCYQVHLMLLGKSKFFNLIIGETSKDGLLNAGIISDPNAPLPDDDWDTKSRQEKLEKNVGVFGIQCLKLDDYWFLDFPHSKMYCIKMKKFEKALRDLQVSLDDFIEVPLIKENPYFTIHVDTSIGRKTFIIDTGAERTIMRCPNEEFIEYRTIVPNRFFIGGVDFGEQEIFLYNFSEKFEYDGALGLDFLNKRSILLDIKNNRIFINKKASSEQCRMHRSDSSLDL